MFFWFLAGAVVAVALVFDSAAMDMRFVAAGALLPLVEQPAGGPWVLHTLVFGVALMFLVMLVARGRRLAQRRWLGVPIGLLAHLVLDGSWANTKVFWWPVAGFDVLGGGQVPEFRRGIMGIVLEVAGLCIGFWAWRRFGLSDREKRRLLIREGRLVALKSS